ncbi:UNVERIFIED_CONTAM: Copia protein [Sesamum angustifolium]|uniref:Copia protein n=1 Tax=Sesamum angustifolium TaxID=2727405 RepID=A0AAW2Q7R2_9LAMI
MLFLTQVDVREPKSFSKANQNMHWREAMDKELEALEISHIWDFTVLPEGKHAIGSRWVFKVKLKQDGSIDRYKARLIAKGYTQMRAWTTMTVSPLSRKQ